MVNPPLVIWLQPVGLIDQPRIENSFLLHAMIRLHHVMNHVRMRNANLSYKIKQDVDKGKGMLLTRRAYILDEASLDVCYVIG